MKLTKIPLNLIYLTNLLIFKYLNVIIFSSREEKHVTLTFKLPPS